MRSSFFIIVSIIIHAMCVAAVVVTPQKISEPEGSEIEVSMGEAAEQAGIAEAVSEEPSTASAPLKAEPQALEPIKPVAKVTPAPTPAPAPKKAPAQPVAKTQPVKKSTPKAAVAPVATTPSEEKVEEAIAQEETAAEDAPVEEEAPAPVAAAPVPVEETAPAGVEADDTTEAASQDVNKTEDPTPAVAAAAAGTGAAAATAPVGKGANPSDDGQLNKGGATQAGAVSYLSLKQAAGNKPPTYPLMARKEGRQGQLELLYRVTKDGKVADVTVAKSSGSKDLDAEAVKAITKFKFVPGQEGWARHPVAFNLKGTAEAAPSKLRAAQAP